jgi:glutamine amidotransferase
MIIIVDYHAGNIGSIKNMLQKLGLPSIISSLPADIEKASHLILPGVGSFDYGMTKLRDLGIFDVLNYKVVQQRTPVLGICLGAQLMCASSEEGKMDGLNWVQGSVKKFPSQNGEKKFYVPLIGWDHINLQKRSKLFDGLAESRFYFVHSYYIRCDERQDVLTTSKHSVEFDSAFEKGNVLGVQFHPEKSHSFGKKLLKNFFEHYQ